MSLFLELCVSKPLVLALNRRLNVYFKVNLQYLPLVAANDFDGQIDYLEQFGTTSVSNFLLVSSNCWTVVACCKCFYVFCCLFGFLQFKESALRKQSLYLKFDPLLRESPKKSAGPAVNTHVPCPLTFASEYDICLS